MKHKKAFTIFFGLLFCGLYSHAQKIKSIKFEELQQTIKDEKSELLLINFWASWCKPCLEELPAFQTIADKYRQKGVKVLLVSLDFEKQVPKAAELLKQKKINLYSVHLNEPDYDSWINRVSPTWQGSIPATWLINTKSNEQTFYEKSFDLKTLETLILDK